MHDEQNDNPPLRKPHERLLGEAQKGIERRGSGERGAERPEMHGQKDGKHQARHAMSEMRPPSRMTMRTGDDVHTDTA